MVARKITGFCRDFKKPPRVLPWTWFCNSDVSTIGSNDIGHCCDHGKSSETLPRPLEIIKNFSVVAIQDHGCLTSWEIITVVAVIAGNHHGPCCNCRKLLQILPRLKVMITNVIGIAGNYHWIRHNHVWMMLTTSSLQHQQLRTYCQC